MRALRDRSPQKLHTVSIRTDNEVLRMVPKEPLNEIIGGIIARYQEIHGIIIYAVCVLSNHYHLLAEAPRGNLSEFAENVNRELARRVNRFLNRRGHFWGRRFDDLIVIEEVDALDGFLYVLTNPVHHGLVSHPRLWPGVSSYWQALGKKDQTYRFTHWTPYHAAVKRARARGEHVSLRDFQTEHTLRISVLPQFRHLSPEERTKLISELIEAKRKSIHEKRLKEGKTTYLGRKAILRQDFEQRPKEVSRRKRPWFYTSNPVARKEAIEEECCRRKVYKEASRRFRSGDYTATFPPSCYLPPLHHVPKPEKPPPTDLAFFV